MQKERQPQFLHKQLSQSFCQQIQTMPNDYPSNGWWVMDKAFHQEVLREESRIVYKIPISVRNGPFGQQGQ